MNLFFDSKFLLLLTGYYNNHKKCITNYDWKWKHALGKCRKIGIVFMDLSKALDIPNHNSLLAKRNACGSSFNATNGFFNDICYFIQEAYIFNTANYNSLDSIDDNFKEEL